jgi:cyclohexanecarboxylate-CoA ligase
MWETVDHPGPERTAEYHGQGWWRGETFLDDLARWARKRPDHPAIISYEGGKLARTVSYSDLALLVARFAGALAELGVSRGDVVVPYPTAGRWPRCT